MGTELNTNQLTTKKVQKQAKLATRILDIFNLRQQPVISIEEDDDQQTLMNCINEAYNEWVVANKNFEFADEIELVDYYTYRVKACEVRYQYYLKKAKETGLNTNLLQKSQK